MARRAASRRAHITCASSLLMMLSSSASVSTASRAARCLSTCEQHAVLHASASTGTGIGQEAHRRRLASRLIRVLWQAENLYSRRQQILHGAAGVSSTIRKGEVCTQTKLLEDDTSASWGLPACRSLLWVNALCAGAWPSSSARAALARLGLWATSEKLTCSAQGSLRTLALQSVSLHFRKHSYVAQAWAAQRM